MVRPLEARGVDAARALAPRAAILRRIGEGQWLAFDRAEDALGHPTAQIMRPTGR